MKKWELAVISGVIICVFLAQFTAFAHSCDNVRSDTLRFHVVANSNSDEDQACKLAVRDALLECYGNDFNDIKTLEDAKNVANNLSAAMQYTAQQVVNANGFDYSVDVKVETMYFTPKQYDGFTLPAGEYSAVRVELGEADGENWFCVLYPALCLPAAAENNEIELFSQDEEEAITSPYTVKFALLEWVQGNLQ